MRFAKFSMISSGPSSNYQSSPQSHIRLAQLSVGEVRKGMLVKVRLEEGQWIAVVFALESKKVVFTKLMSYGMDCRQVLKALKKICKLCLQKNIPIQILKERNLSQKEEVILDIMRQYQVKSDLESKSACDLQKKKDMTNK